MARRALEAARPAAVARTSIGDRRRLEIPFRPPLIAKAEMDARLTGTERQGALEQPLRSGERPEVA